MYAIFGCGAIGAAVALKLSSNDKEVIAIDLDEKRVEDLRRQGVEARVGDAASVTKGTFDGKEPSSLLLMGVATKDLEASIMNVTSLWPEAYLLVRAKDRAAVRTIAETQVKPDHIVFPEEIVTSAVMRQLSVIESRRDAKELVAVLEKVGDGGLAIFMHNNPDPDALASAYGLSLICEHVGVKADIYYGGVIGHQENQAFVKLLGLEMTKVVHSKEAEEIVKAHDKLALVDCSAPGSNNVLPQDMTPNIVLDHHITELDRSAKDFMLNIDAGSTSTAITRLLRELELDITPILATALLYGIRSDTLAFTRGTTTSEFQTAAYLLPLADSDLITKIQTPAMDVETMDVMGKAIKNKETKGPYLLSCVGAIHNRDALAQSADFLLALEGINTVLVFGIEKGNIHISARSNDPRVNIGQVLKDAFEGPGTAGGHAYAAGAHVPLGIFSDIDEKAPLVELAKAVVKKHFFEAIGIHEDDEIPNE